MSENTETRVISIPNILWKIKKASLGTEIETDACYFFRIFWKFKMRLYIPKTDPRQVIAVNMIKHKAPTNLPNVSFSLSCGWLSEMGSNFLLEKRSEVFETDSVSVDGVEIWQHEFSFFQKNFSLFAVDTLYFICIVQLDDTLRNFTEFYRNFTDGTPLLSPICVNALTEDLRNLLDTSTKTDVILKCGEKSIPAHRCILSCRSPVFQAMFQNDFKESEEGVVDIADLEPTVLQKLIHYVYTGNIDKTVESVESLCDLFKAAEKYCIESLKKRCVYLIKENLEPHQACDVLLMSHFYRHEELKDYVVSYIAGKKYFLLSENWRNFAEDNLALAQEVFFCFVRKAEINVFRDSDDMN